MKIILEFARIGSTMQLKCSRTSGIGHQKYQLYPLHIELSDWFSCIYTKIHESDPFIRFPITLQVQEKSQNINKKAFEIKDIIYYSPSSVVSFETCLFNTISSIKLHDTHTLFTTTYRKKNLCFSRNGYKMQLTMFANLRYWALEIPTISAAHRIK